MLRLAWVLLALMAFGSGMSCGAAREPISEYSRATWSTRNGLPHNQVNAIAQTPDGYLWFATWEGLVRYNGQDFRIFGPSNTPALKDNGIRRVTVSPRGSLVVSTSRGGVAVHRQGRWLHYGHTQGLAQEDISDAFEDGKGGLWVAYERDGLTYIAPDGNAVRWGAEQGVPEGRVYMVKADRQNVIWAATGSGLIRLENGRARLFDGGATPTGAVYAVADAPGGGLYLGAQRGLFLIRDGAVRNLAAPGDAVVSLQPDGATGVWFGTVNKGLRRYGPAGLEVLDTDNGMPNNNVRSLFMDREGSLWAGTSNGLIRFADLPFTSIDRNRGLRDNYVRTLLKRPDGSIMIGTARGLSRFEGGRVSPVNGDLSVESEAVLSLANASDGSMWIGMYSTGLLNWKDGKVRERMAEDSPLFGSQVRAILEDRAGNLWVGTSRGLFRKRGAEVARIGEDKGLPVEYVMALHEARDGRIWVGTTAGLVYIENGVVNSLPISRFDDAADVYAFHEDDDGTLWITTDRGVLRLRDGRLAAVNARHGLPVSSIFEIITDRSGNFWLTSNRGVIYAARAEMEAVADGRAPRLQTVRFSEADGMGSAQCNGTSGPAALRDDDGSIWVATADGVAVVQPNELSRHQITPPPALIETLMVDDRNVPLASPIRLPAGSRKVELFFASLLFRSSDQIQYRYRLDGFEDEWIYRDRLRNVQFTNLPPGRYVFRVSASVHGGDWSEGGEGLAFEILPKLHQRAWFYPSVAALALLVVFVLFRFRLSQLRRREAELSATVDERTRALHEKNIELEQLNQQISRQSAAFAQQARTDALTGLSNRRSLDEKLQNRLAAAIAAHQPLCFALLDIDHFKRVNDTWSHDAGDQALCRVAETIRRELGSVFQGRWRGSDLCGRWGGEEFALILPDRDAASALAICERLRAAVEAIDCSGFAPGLTLTVSIGLAERGDISHHEKLVSKADTNLYLAKNGGRNRVCGS
ncbi:hypothetical protein GCM10010960_15560 [Arenimonas maotaiensis]|uniref:diguanylate cyclase n=1 Tax=Arenimonas maotaiensis TaxID=1446479 RepID=A0A917CPW1_9GAMM|nr:ligand-binding sensor domain-containing diguanylate cyclase [Arenimonas maotaiensis]GGF94735.1 hypothetical protein GCM10010960_15560 [Arenimonas maotaiensis]